MNSIKLLRIVFFSGLLAAGLLVLLFETEMLESGALAGDEQTAYWLSIVGVALTIIAIPTALKLMTWKRVKTDVTQSEQSYVRWSVLRLLMLTTPLMYNLLVYYLLGCEPTYAYMALMLLLVFLFVWPSQDKMNYERELDKQEKES